MNAPMLSIRQPVKLPDEFYTPSVRPGYELVRGVPPVEGERVWLTGWSCYSVFGDGGLWFFVERVEPMYLRVNRWLIGVELTKRGLRCRKPVNITRLVIERAVAPERLAS